MWNVRGEAISNAIRFVTLARAASAGVANPDGFFGVKHKVPGSSGISAKVCPLSKQVNQNPLGQISIIWIRFHIEVTGKP